MDSAVVPTSLNKDHIAAGLSCLGRTSKGTTLAFLKADLSNLFLLEIEELTEYTALQDINLQNNRLTSLAPLSTLRHIIKLNLERNALSDPNVITVLPPTLTHLNLSQNAFLLVPKIAHLSLLVELYLDGNQIKSLEGIEKLSNLTVISAKNNAIQDLNIFNHAQFISLKRLNLDKNQISNLAPLARLTTVLQELTVSENDIMHLEILSNFRFLMILDVQSNNLNEIEEISQLKSVASLRHLYARDNPMTYPPLMDVEEEKPPRDDVVASDSGQIVVPEPPLTLPTLAEHYKEFSIKLIALLPQIESLDGVKISAEDKVKAETAFLKMEESRASSH